MERKKFNFDVNTFSNCFICFDEIVEELKNERKFFPLQNILQYLQIALRNIESFSNKSETLLNRTEIRVRLCKECERTIKTFTELYKTLESTKLKLNCTAGVLQKKLISTDKAGHNRLDKYKLKLESSSPSDLKVLRHFKLAKELRNEIVEKCGKVVAVSQPTVKLIKLNNAEIQKLTTRSFTKESTSKVASEFQGTAESLPIIKSVIAVVTKQEVEEDGESYDDIIPENEEINQEDVNDVVFTSKDSRETDNSGIDNTSVATNGFECKPEVKNQIEPTSNQMKSQYLYDKVTGRYNCGFPSCPKQFKTQKSLSAHHFRHRHRQFKVKPSPSFKCPDPSCSIKFFEAASATIHYDSFHRQTRYKCDLCQVKFSQRDWLEQHKKDCTVSQNSQNVKLVYEKLQKISQSLGKKPTEEGDPTKFNCPESTCRLKFKWKASAQNHYKSVHLKGSYECGKCQKKFFHPKTFSNHKDVCQGKKNKNTCEDTSGSNKDPLRKRERKFKCPESTCVRTFFQRTAAIKHYQTVHLKIRYKCENCSVRPFHTLQSLQFHQLKYCKSEK